MFMEWMNTTITYEKVIHIYKNFDSKMAFYPVLACLQKSHMAIKFLAYLLKIISSSEHKKHCQILERLFVVFLYSINITYRVVGLCFWTTNNESCSSVIQLFNLYQIFLAKFVFSIGMELMYRCEAILCFSSLGFFWHHSNKAD